MNTSHARIFKDKILTSNHIMIDCETLGVGHNSPVLTIGLVQFRFDNTDQFDDVYNNKDRVLSLSLDVQSQFDKGIVPTFSTIEWWMSQNANAQSNAFNLKNKDKVENCLFKIDDFINKFRTKDSENVFLWANGSLADTVWLENLYQKFNIQDPFSYKEKMCYRTIVSLFDYERVDIPNSIHHDAVSDSIYQIIQLQNIFKKLKEI